MTDAILGAGGGDVTGALPGHRRDAEGALCCWLERLRSARLSPSTSMSWSLRSVQLVPTEDEGESRGLRVATAT
jgi:hypothetical protein